MHDHRHEQRPLGDAPRIERFPDHARTTRSHAGESIRDSWNWPGLIVFAVGIVGLALSVTAAADGFATRAVSAGVIGAACLVTGALLVIAEHRRVKHREGHKLTDPRGH